MAALHDSDNNNVDTNSDKDFAATLKRRYYSRRKNSITNNTDMGFKYLNKLHRFKYLDSYING